MSPKDRSQGGDGSSYMNGLAIQIRMLEPVKPAPPLTTVCPCEICRKAVAEFLWRNVSMIQQTPILPARRSSGRPVLTDLVWRRPGGWLDLTIDEAVQPTDDLGVRRYTYRVVHHVVLVSLQRPCIE